MDQFSGSDPDPVLPSEKIRIGSFSFPVSDPCGDIELAWIDKGVILDYAGESLEDQILKINPGVLSFVQDQIDAVDISVNEGVLNVVQNQQSYTIEWFVDGQYRAEYEGFTIDPAEAGQYHAIIKSQCSEYKTQEMTVTNELVTAASKNISTSKGLHFAPNPFTEKTVLSYVKGAKGDIRSVTIYSVDGIMIKQLHPNGSNFTITTKDVKHPGVYLVKVETSSGVQEQKLIYTR
jgi:hypothetical protein